jgi:hypothetical protein
MEMGRREATQLWKPEGRRLIGLGHRQLGPYGMTAAGVEVARIVEVLFHAAYAALYS